MNSTKPSQCASDMQMEQRSSNVFKYNVYSNTIIAVLTLVLSVKALIVIRKRPIFSSSTSILLQLNILVVNVHEIIYAIIQLWSFYRSIVYSDEPCSIMFTEYECFPWYTANIGSRLMILFTLCALTIDILLSMTSMKSSTWRGSILFLIAGVCTFFLCKTMTRDGPNDNIQANCYQRLNRNIGELKLQISIYLYVIMICSGIDFFAMAYFFYRKRTQKRFDVSQQYEKLVARNSSMAIAFIVAIELICMGVYSVSVNWIIDHGKEHFELQLIGNLVLWCYTYPYASVLLPTGILGLTTCITYYRKKTITNLRATNLNEHQCDHFKKLKGQWDVKYEKRQSLVKIDP